jgi:hypothetical protein
MNKEFIPYEQALELKELGFGEPCFGWFTNSYLRIGSVVENKHVQGEDETLAPLYQQAFRWFREKYGLYTDLFVDDDQTFGFCVSSFAEEGKCRLDKPIKRQFSTYEESELECIKFLIEIVERKPEAYS